MIDLSSWGGIGLAAGGLMLAGGPSRLKLSPGLLGFGQAVSLGSLVGAVSAFGCIYSMMNHTAPADEDDSDD